MKQRKLTKDMFQPLDKTDKEAIALMGSVDVPSISFWKDAWRRFYSNKGAMLGLCIVLLLTLGSIIFPLISNYTYWNGDSQYTNQESFGDHYFGTDDQGRDLWTRVWCGTGISIFVAFLAVFLDLIIGVAYGSISGYFGGKVDNIMQRIMEVIQSIPSLIILILIILVIGQGGIFPIALAMGLTGWFNMARVVRAQMLQLKSQEYILAAKTLGSSHFRILMRHLIPNVIGSIIITVTFAIPTAIFFEAFLSFIGLGLPDPEASLGSLLNIGKGYFQTYPYQMVYPSLFITLIMLGFNLLGDGLRDSLDPRMRR